MRMGISNMQISTDGINYQPICSTSEIELTTQETEVPEWMKQTSASFELKLHKKKNGNILEKCLYYGNNKKKRIRKKYEITRILTRGR